VKEEPPDIADEEERDLHTPQPNDQDFRLVSIAAF
jgi:hypothetical protein